MERNITALLAVLEPLAWSCVPNAVVAHIFQALTLLTKELSDNMGVLSSGFKLTIFYPSQAKWWKEVPLTRL